MIISREVVAGKLAAYLSHEITLSELVEWAESAIMEADLDEHDYETVRDVLSRLGIADVRPFGLTWEDCEEMLRRLGFSVHLRIEAV